MMAPASGQVAEKLNVTSQLEREMLVSIFVLCVLTALFSLQSCAAHSQVAPCSLLLLCRPRRVAFRHVFPLLHSDPPDRSAFAVGPLAWGPASELFGRVRVLQLANVLYLVFNLVCAWAPNKGTFIAFRFLAGLGGGAPLSVGAGVLSDLWRAEERGKGAALYSLGPLLGPALGPVMGAWITEKVPNDGYKWIFVSTTAVRPLVFRFAVAASRRPHSRPLHPQLLVERLQTDVVLTLLLTSSSLRLCSSSACSACARRTVPSCFVSSRGPQEEHGPPARLGPRPDGA